jgi:two-component system alkaline phosphatase synthesis response regulator PhoP
MFAAIVDDEPLARRRLRGVLEGTPLVTRVEECASGREAIALFEREQPDVLFLDVQMPDLGGFDVAGWLDEEAPAIVFVTAYDQYAVRAFDVRALDYLLKPFDDARVVESVQRVDAFLRMRRTAQGGDAGEGDRHAIGDVIVDLGTCQVWRDGGLVPLRPKEFELLRALVRREGRVATRLELLQEVWGYADDVESRTLDTHIAMLRRRLERDPAQPRLVHTVRTIGYRVEPPRPLGHH